MLNLLLRIPACLLAIVLATPTIYAITIPIVPIGNPGNPADTRYVNLNHPNGVGAVPYSFFMGKTEVTNAQYVAFLNAVAATDPYGLYNSAMDNIPRGGITRNGASGSYTYTVKTPALNGAYTYGDKPVVYVNSGDAMRFANWLNNGQPTGPENTATTEDGAYTLNGAVSNAQLIAVTRNPGARWWLPNDDEWYKAAYHKNDGPTANYWNYPTATDNAPNNNLPTSDTGDSANLRLSNTTTGNSSYPTTDAGAYSLSRSAYGTFDQGGNAAEWVETLAQGAFEPLRQLRGGSWSENTQPLQASYYFDAVPPNSEDDGIGFRVAGIPEPATISYLTLLTGMWCLRRKRLSPSIS